MSFNQEDTQYKKIEKQILEQNKKRGIFRLISILALISSPWNLILILFGVAVAFQRFPLKDKFISIGIMGTYVMTLLSYFIFKSMYDSANERFSAGDFENTRKHCFRIKIFFGISILSLITLGALMYVVWIHK